MRQAQRGASEAMGWPNDASACVRTTRILYCSATTHSVTNDARCNSHQSYANVTRKKYFCNASYARLRLPCQLYETLQNPRIYGGFHTLRIVLRCS
jgi:hypothetical protein